MRNIEFIAVHCTAGNQKNTTLEGLRKHWRSLGWKTDGYHYLIFADGKIENLVEEELKKELAKHKDT